MVWSIGWADEPAGKSDKTKTTASTLITLDVANAPLADVLRLLARQAEAEIIFDRNLAKGKVTATLRDRRLDEVLRSICDPLGLQCRVVDNVFFIEPRSSLPAAQSSEPASADALRKRIAELEAELNAIKKKYADSHAQLLQQQAELDFLYEGAKAKALQVETPRDVTAAFADLAQAEGALKLAEAELKAAEDNLRETKERHKAGAASQAEVRQAETAVAKARANRDKTKIALTLAQTRAEQWRNMLAAQEAHLDLVKSLANPFHLPGVGIVSESQLLVPAEPLRKMVSLSEKNAKLEDILHKLSQQTGIPMTIHESVSKDIQVTNATLYGVTLADALHLLLQQAGLRAVPSEDRKGIVIVPPNRIEVKRSTAPSSGYNLDLRLNLPQRGDEVKGSTAPSSGYGIPFYDTRSLVTSPLADLVAQPKKGEQSEQSLKEKEWEAIRLQRALAAHKSVAYCSKCKNPLQLDWLFCPKCGAKNERTTGKDWKFCPTCGRAVSTTGSASGVTTTVKKK